MTKEAPMPNVEYLLRASGHGMVRHSTFVIISSFALTHSSFTSPAYG
jgi:hypothetical protein